MTEWLTAILLNLAFLLLMFLLLPAKKRHSYGNSDRILKRALRDSLERIDFDFGDDFAKSLRKSLMTMAILAIAASAINPSISNGNYEINLTFMKGEIKSFYIYVFVLVSCIYCISHFLFYCKALIAKSYENISSFYADRVAEGRAFEIFSSFQRERLSNLGFSPQFVSGGAGSYDHSVVTTEISIDHAKKSEPEFLSIIEEIPELEVSSHNGNVRLMLRYDLTGMDRLYLDIYLDKFWRVRKAQRIFVWVPILLGVFGVTCLILKMASLFL